VKTPDMIRKQITYPSMTTTQRIRLMDISQKYLKTKGFCVGSKDGTVIVRHKAATDPLSMAVPLNNIKSFTYNNPNNPIVKVEQFRCYYGDYILFIFKSDLLPT